MDQDARDRAAPQVALALALSGAEVARGPVSRSYTEDLARAPERARRVLARVRSRVEDSVEIFFNCIHLSSTLKDGIFQHFG